MKQIDVYTPSQVLNGENPAPISQYNLQFLAQGDSWFSTGAVPPSFTTNLFDGMGTSTIGACAVNCAQPGAHLSLMVDSTRDRQFMAFLNGVQSRRWAGLLLSGGGNDMIARVVGERWGRALGQSFVVDNQSGGGGVIACMTTARNGLRHLAQSGICRMQVGKRSVCTSPRSSTNYSSHETVEKTEACR